MKVDKAFAAQETSKIQGKGLGHSPFTSMIYAVGVTFIVAHNLPHGNDNDPSPKTPSPAVAILHKKAANENVRAVARQAPRANFMTGELPDAAEMEWVTTSNGRRFRANPKSAPYLKGFINDLLAAGAPIVDIGGYNPRHIAGSTRWSQHAYGNAVDLDQLGRNRVTAEFDTWAKGHADVIREAARKWRIVSGADFHVPDLGHYEFGGPGTEAQLPASIRYNNPGAQYPADWAKSFGMDGRGVIGGGHLIAHFPDQVAGAAANMFLLNKSYADMTIGAAGKKWTGSNGFGVPGYDPNKVLTRDLLNDPTFMIPFMKAIAAREAGRKSPLTDDQWRRAFQAFQSGKY